MESAKDLSNKVNVLDPEDFCKEVHALSTYSGRPEHAIIDQSIPLGYRYDLAYQVLNSLYHPSRSYGSGSTAEESKAITVTPENDYYSLLGVNENATQEEIEKAFQQKSNELQPDVVEKKLRESGLSEEDIKIALDSSKRDLENVNEAYSGIGNKEIRLQYDEFLKKSRGIKQDEEKTSPKEKNPIKTARNNEVLGVGPNPTQIELRSAYRNLAKELHPNAYLAKVGKNRKDLSPEEIKELNIREEKWLEVNRAYSEEFNQQQLSKEREEIAGQVSGSSIDQQNIVISATPTVPEMDASRQALKKTEKFRETINQAGYVTITPEQTAELQSLGIAPATATSEELSAGVTTSLNLHAMGVGAESYSGAIDQAVNQGIMTPRQGEFSQWTAYTLESLEVNDPKLTESLSIGNREPTVTIQQVPVSETPPPKVNQIVLQPQGDNLLKPLLDEATGLIKGKAEKAVVSTLEKGGVSVAKNTAQKLTMEALKKSGKELITKVGSKIAVKAGLSAAGAAISGGTSLIIQAVYEIGKKLLSAAKKAVSAILSFVTGKEDIRSQLKELSGYALVLSLISGAIIPAILSGGVFLTTLGAGSIIGGITGFINIFVFTVTAIVLAVSWPVILAAFVLLFFILFTLIIINNSSFVIPPGGFGPPLTTTTESLYINVEKTATPGTVDNPPPSRTVNYTITVGARQLPLTNISFTYDCYALTENGRINCPTSPAIPPPPSEIVAGQPFSFSYSMTYDSRFIDSIVIDTFTVTANVTGGPVGEDSQASASVIIGTPPTGCYVFDGYWPDSQRADMQAAVIYLTSNYPGYIARVCTGGTLGLRYNPTPNTYWGRFHGTYIEFFPLAFTGRSGLTDTIYILAHESAHALAERIPSIYASYEAYPNILTEVPFCLYTYSANLYEERFSEAIAIPASNICSNFQSRYPIHYQFVSTNVY